MSGTACQWEGAKQPPYKTTKPILVCACSLGPGSMRVISPAAVGDEQLVAEAGYMGAPTGEPPVLCCTARCQRQAAHLRTTPRGAVGLEKLDAHQAEAAVQAAVAALRSTASDAGDPGPGQLAAVMAGEIGGGNGIEPLVVGSRLGLPVVDGDLMGRAFPELQVQSQTPAAVAE